MKALLLLLLTGCGVGDVCDAFPDQSCIAIDLSGAVSYDQVRLFSTQLQLVDVPSPATPLATPIDFDTSLLVLPDRNFAGQFIIEVRAFLKGAELARTNLGTVLVEGAHIHLPFPLTRSFDLAGPVSFDLLTD